MRKIALVMMLLSCYAMAHAQSFQERKIIVLPSSNLTIIGDSNIAKFQCKFETSYLDKSQVVRYSLVGNQVIFTDAVLALDNRGFDCGSRGINQDFNDLLQTEQHPKILLELKKAVISSPTQALATVRITIAEKHKIFEVPVVIEPGEVARFKGNLQLNIREYGLEPPKKLFGMIVIKDEIEINFDLFVKK